MRRRPINGRRIVLVGRHACWALAILIIVVAFALAGPGAGAAATPPDANLLRTYQPVLIFHPNELFRPTKVQSYIDAAELEQFVGISPAELPYDAYWRGVDSNLGPGELPPPTPRAVYRPNQPPCPASA